VTDTVDCVLPDCPDSPPEGCPSDTTKYDWTVGACTSAGTLECKDTATAGTMTVHGAPKAGVDSSCVFDTAVACTLPKCHGVCEYSAGLTAGQCNLIDTSNGKTCGAGKITYTRKVTNAGADRPDCTDMQFEVDCNVPCVCDYRADLSGECTPASGTCGGDADSGTQHYKLVSTVAGCAPVLPSTGSYTASCTPNDCTCPDNCDYYIDDSKPCTCVGQCGGNPGKQACTLTSNNKEHCPDVPVTFDCFTGPCGGSTCTKADGSALLSDGSFNSHQNQHCKSPVTANDDNKWCVTETPGASTGVAKTSKYNPPNNCPDTVAHSDDSLFIASFPGGQTAHGTVTLTQPVTDLTPNAAYTISAWIRTTVLGRTDSCTVQFVVNNVAGDSETPTVASMMNPCAGDRGYTQISQCVTADSNGELLVNIVMTCTGGTNTASDNPQIFLDDVTLCTHDGACS